MSAALAEQMRRHAMMARGAYVDPALGVITSLDTANYCAKVMIEPDGVETGWLPILSQWAGSGWGLFLPLPVGTQVMVVFSEANPEIGVIAGALFHDAMRPLDCPEGEAWLVHESGSHLKLLNDGNIAITAPLTTIDGELKVTGDITDQTGGGNSVTVKEHRDAYNEHKHGGVDTGAGETQTTDSPAE